MLKLFHIAMAAWRVSITRDPFSLVLTPLYVHTRTHTLAHARVYINACSLRILLKQTKSEHANRSCGFWTI